MTVCVAVQVIDAPGASGDRVAGVQIRFADVRSVTVTLCRVTLPSLVATIV